MTGILVFEDRNAHQADQFTGNSTGTFNGVLYLPSSQLTYAGNATNNNSNISIIAKDLNFTGNGTLGDPLAANAPAIVRTVLLIE
jgi:hypothetical protein